MKRKATPPVKTITQLCEEFLADQKTRLSPKTFQNYQSIIDLYQNYLESYWPCQKYSEKTTFCETYGPDEITDGFEEFTGYYMPRKVMCGQDLMRAAGTVTKKLAKWLVAKGYLTGEMAEDVVQRTSIRARDLPNTQAFLRALEQFVDNHGGMAGGNEMQDHFTVSKVEPGIIWLEPMLASVRLISISVPTSVSALCEPGWDIGGIVVKVGRKWEFQEVWNVSP